VRIESSISASCNEWKIRHLSIDKLAFRER